MKRILIVLACMLAPIVLIIVWGGFYVLTAKELPVTDQHKALLITASDLAPYYTDFVPLQSSESFECLRYVDDSTEINYEYHNDHDDHPYILTTINKEVKRDDANFVYRIAWSGQQLGLNLYDGDFDVEEVNTFYSAGERSRFGNILHDGEMVGHFFVAQEGNTVYSFTLSGFILDDPALWTELVTPKLEAAVTFQRTVKGRPSLAAR